jgi:hypothetical protein
MAGLFSEFAPMLRRFTDADLASEIERPEQLRLDRCILGGQDIEIAYAPFDYVNRDAKIVIVGMTPGRQQMRNALVEARRCLLAGRSEDESLRAAKVFASFSGPMRTNLVALLDDVGVNQWLGVPSTASLWTTNARWVHFTSALRYPVFVNGANYSGAPSMISTALLRTHLLQWFGDEMETLADAVFVPLGPKVAEALDVIVSARGIDRNRILSGLPHPSGANAERIAFFLGRKRREDLSSKVEPLRLVAARTSLTAKILALGQA